PVIQSESRQQIGNGFSVHLFALVRCANDRHLARTDIKPVGSTARYDWYRLNWLYDRSGGNDHGLIAEPGDQVPVRLNGDNRAVVVSLYDGSSSYFDQRWQWFPHGRQFRFPGNH